MSAIRGQIKERAELIRFLGVMNFISDFIKNFAERAKPLYDILKVSWFNRKSSKWKPVKISELKANWGAEQYKS